MESRSIHFQKFFNIYFRSPIHTGNPSSKVKRVSKRYEIASGAYVHFYIFLGRVKLLYFSLVSLEINGSSICTVPPSSSPSVSLYKTFEKIQIWKIVKILTALLLGQSVIQSERVK